MSIQFRQIFIITAFLIVQSLALVHGYEHLSDSDHADEESCSYCLLSHGLGESINDSNNLVRATYLDTHRANLDFSLHFSSNSNSFVIRSPPITYK